MSALALALIPAPAGAFSLDIRDVHVTQGTQTVKWAADNPLGFAAQDGNTIPLVAERATAVRVVMNVVLAAGESPPGNEVIGGIIVRVDDQVVVPQTGRYTINQPFTPPMQGGLVLDDDSLNFELPADVMVPRDRFRDATSDVSISVFVGEGDRIIDSSTVTFTMHNLARPRILAEPITYTPRSNAGPDPDVMQPGRGDAFLSATFPMEDRCFRPRPGVVRCPYLPQPTGFSTDVDENGNGILDYDIDPADDTIDASEPIALIEELQDRRSLYSGVDGAVGETTFLWGWIPNGSLAGHGGVADFGGNVGYGIDRPDFAQMAFAHELTHMHGLVEGTFLNHNDPGRTLQPNLGWDVGGRLIGNPAQTGITERVKRFALRDIVNNEGNVTNAAWADATTFRRLIDAQPLQRTISAAAGVSAARAAGAPRPCRAVTVRGEVTRYATRAGRLVAQRAALKPAFPGSCAGERPARRADAQLFAEVSYRVGRRVRTRRVPVDSRIIVNRHLPELKGPGHPVVLGPFSVNVPVGGVVTSVRLVDRARRTLDRLTRSRTGPSLAVRRFNRGLTLGRGTTLRWSASDRDTRDSRLRYHVAYSPDGGASFVPVAVNLRTPRLAVDGRRLPRSSGRRGVLRVLASDGLNTRVRDLRGVTNRLR